MTQVRLGLVGAALVAALAAVAACGAEPRAGERSSKTKIAFTASLRGFPGTWVVAADGSGLARLSQPYRRTRRTELLPVWSPDGTRIAFLAYLEKDALSGGAEYHVYVMDADGRDVRNLTAGRVAAPGNFDRSPDGRKLVLDAFDERQDPDSRARGGWRRGQKVDWRE
jgi:Tol biopolymer transport system component